jgi:hypothetical protein
MVIYFPDSEHQDLLSAGGVRDTGSLGKVLELLSRAQDGAQDPGER